ncbi:intraflagellar transport protein 52 [Trichuris trichiura]|uniref:Intraflagellar transport protein 52 n=1 Tax=Trichuris trichiura TaxID=36087 RepID=A0A077ZA58_TRITR|nr:intraflagellar transport protein 52 [Trichuris trichiura]
MQGIETCQKFVEAGHNLFVLIAAKGKKGRLIESLNDFLEPYGIKVNDDSVIRTRFDKYFHPMEALVVDGVGATALAMVAGRSPSDDEFSCSKALKFVYPYGCTLTLTKGACAQLLSSGSMCHPFNQSLCALFHSKVGSESSGGKVLVIGSNIIFSDAFLDKEDNNLLLVTICMLLTPMEYHVTPDSVAGSNEVKCCLQEAETKPLSDNIEHIFNSTLHSIDYRLWPDVIRKVNYAALMSNWTVRANLRFAQVFPPIFRIPSLPALELIDLDEEFASESERLALEARKHTEDQLDAFIMKCAEILAITEHLKPGFQSPKNVLEFVCNQVMEFKKLNQFNVETPDTKVYGFFWKELNADIFQNLELVRR